jgi:hypothetical protein
MNDLLISKIFAKIKKTPDDVVAYEDLFSVCRSIEESDFEKAHTTNKRLRELISQCIVKRVNVSEMFEL